MTTPAAVPPARSPGCFRAAVIFAILLLAGGAGLLLFRASYLSAGLFDAARMNAIVEAVRRQQVGEKEIYFQIEDLSRPESLRPGHPFPGITGLIHARMIDGGLQIAIITRDRGHLGEYGFVYSEVPLVEVDRMGSTIYYNIPLGLEYLGRKIDDHWWEAANLER
jgi:hypothetical protein